MNKKQCVAYMGIVLAIAYIISIILLLLLTCLFYFANPGTSILSAGLFFTYVTSSFVGGFLLGKRLVSKKYLWGFLFGSLYYLLLLLISLFMGMGASLLLKKVLTTFFICAGSGMLGGMVA